MHKYIWGFIFVFLIVVVDNSAQDAPTLADFWEGRAQWLLEIENVGLPVGESDTIDLGNGRLRSYVHASYQSVGMFDQCGEPVAFPGCLTHYESTDGGMSFVQSVRICDIPCDSCPCQDQLDHHGYRPDGSRDAAQQYPRVAVADNGKFYMVYEWHAQTIIRQSADGLNWSDWSYLLLPGGTWPYEFHPCSTVEYVGEHPFLSVRSYDCLVGAPPGIYVEGDTLFVFVAAGESPGHMRCYKGNRHGDLSKLQLCENDPLFSSVVEYGPLESSGVDANPYFDFRYVSSADVMRVDGHYYMAFEGIRGPEEGSGGDSQFALGFARSVTSEIDGTWEKYENNPVIGDVGFHYGIGHADLIVLDGVTYLYTATSTENETRGRFMLVWVEG
jgi:hypothetical protein